MLGVHSQDLLHMALRHQAEVRAEIWMNQETMKPRLIGSQFSGTLPDAPERPRSWLARILSFLF